MRRRALLVPLVLSALGACASPTELAEVKIDTPVVESDDGDAPIDSLRTCAGYIVGQGMTCQ